ncbi:rho guanine nucleotide exchange factor 10-like isoform X2 [Paramacrobiotus metropolitanus]|uniref:rho guanine nucleotide exchange factor 10-like isoform X2 n=1 Tax=Paramacrobiotus metropolitanus TaxID=2943436 RepID=UPI0024463455|nr:rho guanine nucleotide exchange factor 10-like isoform X2 [Paramacrobiotus metropolitanus]
MISSWKLTGALQKKGQFWRTASQYRQEIKTKFIVETSPGEECTLTGPICPPPQLPAASPNMKRDEIVRRHVLGSIIDSENSYVDSLLRLVRDYQEPLKESVPPIISAGKINSIFSKIPQILQIHLMLRTALSKLMNEWKTEKLSELGDVFVGLFSKPYVAETYAAYVCNFANAIETIKKISKERPVFAEFLRTRQESSKDRLPLFGLLVKPVQRFPQFILLLQDLLKHTPTDNVDRISLQLALTHLETLADCLNERKREYEEEKSAKDVLKWAKIPAGYRNSNAGGPDELVRRVVAEDDFTELELNASGGISRTKTRRLFLLNDLLICTVPRNELSDRFSLQWIVNIADMQVIDEKPVKFLGYQISNAASESSKQEPTGDHITKLYLEMADLRQDYEAVKRIHDIVEGLRYDYVELRSGQTRRLLNDIQNTIQVKMEEAARADHCTFQILIPNGKSKNQKIRLILQASKRKDKLLWITLLHLTRLAYDKKKNPCWDDPDIKGITHPLFFLSKTLHSQAGQRKFMYKCGCYCFTAPKEEATAKAKAKLPAKPDGLVYLCSGDGLNSRVSILSIGRLRNSTLKQQDATSSIELLSFTLTQTDISCCEWIPGIYEVDLTVSAKGSLAHDSVWLGTESGTVMVFLASAKVSSLGSYCCDAPVRSIHFSCDKVYVSLANCSVKIFKRSAGGTWELRPAATIQCVVSGILSFTVDLPNKILCAIGSYVYILDCTNDTIVDKHQPRKSSEIVIEKMARCGIGLWISYKNSSIISLFHSETFKHLQDINIAPNVNRILAEKNSERSVRDLFVTSLLAIRGSLWIGTNSGLVVHVTLPKLDGVPISLSRPAVSLHSHVGPASLLMALQPKTVTRKQPAAPSRSSLADVDLLDSHPFSCRLSASSGNQMVKMWLDESPDVIGMYGALMRGSFSSEEDLSSREASSLNMRRRHSFPHLPVDAEFHSPRPVSFLRNPERLSMAQRPTGHPQGRPVSFSPISDWHGFSTPSQGSSKDSDHMDGPAVVGKKSVKPKFVKMEKDGIRSIFGPQWHSTLIVISAGSGYRMWRGSSENDQNDGSLCVVGWEMKV